MGDSLLREAAQLLKPIPYLTVKFYPGARVEGLIQKFTVQFQPEFWNGVQFVWLHVGTNDIDSQHSVQFIVKKYKTLILIIRARLGDIHIVCTGILPRLKDWVRSKSKVRETNKKLKKLSVLLRIRFFPMGQPFTFQGVPLDRYYRRDGLHLSSQGSEILVKCVKQTYAEWLRSL